MSVPKYTSKDVERFWSKVDRSGGDDACWIWTAGQFREGYGCFALCRNGKGYSLHSHRVAWELINDEIPQGLCVLHSCDNPPCCNPFHLFLGTRKLNNKDRQQKGRSFIPIGELNPRHKLTTVEVKEIRQFFAQGNMTRAQLADKYEVGIHVINMVIRRATWKHV